MDELRFNVHEHPVHFPAHLVFGASTSAYQVEGAVYDGHRGVSIWDEFCRRGKIQGGTSGAVACAHYEEYPRDIELMDQLGLQAYRFSIAWPRVMPGGAGLVNRKGLHFYERIVDRLLRCGITPYVTLFHWDMPAALMKRYGGFLDRRAAGDFADYVEVVVRALGDRVKHWITLNDPAEHALQGYVTGAHAPGLRRPWSYLTVMHHQLLAHGMAVARIRDLCAGAQVGISLGLTPAHPSSDGVYAKNCEAARVTHELINQTTLDPLLRGHYPQELWRRLRAFRPHVAVGDMQTIQAPLDFIGINHYRPLQVRFSRWMPFLNSRVVERERCAEENLLDVEVPRTAMGWEIDPAAMRETLSWLREQYGNPAVYITENGAAFEDRLIDGSVQDPRRVAYLAVYLSEVQRAIAEGSDVRGYFVHSLLDGFEWQHGYTKRFGLVHVDFETQARTIKSSGRWYAERIRAHLAAHRISRQSRPQRAAYGMRG